MVDSNSLHHNTSFTEKLILSVLAISAFCIGTTEFGMAGILPEISQSFHISIPEAGLLMTAYALGVSVSAPIITAATISLSRKNVLLSLMGIFVLGNLISAIAITFNMLMFGRVLASLCHGAFFGVGAVVAVNVVSPHNRGIAVAWMFSGLTFANLIGVPIGTFLGQNFGWESIFWVIACFGIINIICIKLFVPNNMIHAKGISLKHEIYVFKNLKVWLYLLVTAFGFGGVFTFFAYIAPIMISSAGFLPNDMMWLLLVFGSGLVIGNWLGGKAADYSLTNSIIFLFILLIIILTLFVFTIHFKVITVINLFLIGILCFAISSPMQTQVMRSAQDSPNIASAVNISAFNIGIAIGTYLGGVFIHLGFGYTSVNFVGVAMVLGALIIQILSLALN